MDAQTKDTVKFVGIIIGVGFIGRLLLQKIGLLKTAEDEQAAANANTLMTGAAANASVISPSNPALSMNKNYWLAIMSKWKKDNNKTTVSISDLNKLFNPDFTNGLSYNINLAKLADLIANSKKVWYIPDTEEQVYGAFRSMKSQAQISKMAGIFFDTFKIDLLAYLQSFMNGDQLSKVFLTIKPKPLL